MAGGFQQTTNTVMMVRPAAFGPNPETAESNAFQSMGNLEALAAAQPAAAAEFEDFVQALREAGVRVVVVQDTDHPPKPDAVFPNNWVSFHEDGRAALYPLFSRHRRPERRIDVIEAIAERFHLREAVDYSEQEVEGRYLEGTGSMVLDRIDRVAYACRSPRTSEEVLEAFCNDFYFVPMVFGAVDRQGVPIYHTNVMMSIGSRFALLCPESIRDAQERESVLARLEQSGREIVPIRFEQMEAFAGNILELATLDRGPVIAMSDQAYDSLDAGQIEALEGFGEIVSAPIDTIETFGGGSARCMLCEVFLAPK